MSELTEKGINKRDEILAAADKMFRKYGYDAVTLRMLANEVKISTGHLHHYFKKKDDVLFALIDNLTNKLWKYSREVFLPNEDPLAIYAFSHCWFFLTATALPDLRRLIMECSRNCEMQKRFSQYFAGYFLEAQKDSAYHFSIEQVQTAVLAAQAAHFALLNEHIGEIGNEIIINLSQTHVQLMFHLLGLKISTAKKINDYVANQLKHISIEDIVEPFKLDYQWYEIDAYEFKLKGIKE